MSEALKKTPLHALHLAAGAKMVDFAGWEMPLHYGSQIEEHHRVRRDAGIFDVSHMLALDVCGPGARDFLRRILANDVVRLAREGEALYSCMLAADGGVLDDLIVYAMPHAAFRLVVNAGTAEKDLVWLEGERAHERARIEITPRRDLAIVAVQGPAAREKLWSAWPHARSPTEALGAFEAAELGASMVARTGYTGEDGFEVLLPAGEAPQLWSALAQLGAAPAGLGARDTLRLEAGMNLYGQDMDERVTPLESGLAWTVDMSSERDFVGRSALERFTPERTLLGLVLEAGGVMRAHQRVRTAAGEGEVTSGGYAPTLQRSIALARLPRVVSPGAHAEVEVRGRWMAARVVKPPFVRRGRIMI
jgi:aminomethyltransferase